MYGREITTKFYFPHDLALSLTSYTLQTPPGMDSGVGPTMALRVDYGAFQALKTEFPILTKLDLRLAEYYAVWQEERLRQFRLLDAT